MSQVIYLGIYLGMYLGIYLGDIQESCSGLIGWKRKIDVNTQKRVPS